MSTTNEHARSRQVWIDYAKGIGIGLVPRILVELDDAPEGLRVKAVLVYGDPPVARVEDGHVVKLGAVVPARDICRSSSGLPVSGLRQRAFRRRA